MGEGGGGLVTTNEKKFSASEMVKASAKGQEEVACGFLIKY